MADPELTFAAAGGEGWRPLADRMRPSGLDEFVGQSHLLAPGKPLRRLSRGAACIRRSACTEDDAIRLVARTVTPSSWHFRP
jgi:hypothetical protein